GMDTKDAEEFLKRIIEERKPKEEVGYF
ncbi:DNA-binding protein, partial [Thermococcus sp. ES12]|nr:DNA-binding protein [Thermococcus sp. ES12]